MLSAEVQRKIDRELTKYPADQKQSAVMSALRLAQEEHGYLSTEVIEAVAKYLDMPPVAVWEVATFYSMYNLEPVGKYKLTICTNLPCALSGAVEAAEHIKKRLGIGFNETTPDGKFTLKEGECFGACGDAPVMLQNNHKMLCGMTPEKIDQLLAELGKD
ncbi:MAG: NADH-quinone oxidoreductase subunit NuoE [Burkholderiales bacterium]|nr:NADH-quinone oxidoreductase subunit NuoE [Burkholderiales bacterium]PZN04918.1 MAG: NADH-quinone oxidoreductase subunit NuoE [Pseudomonadota bacterium]